MDSEGFMSSDYTFNWTSFCGTSSFTVWDASKNNFEACFQKLILSCGSFSLLAIVSSYYIGKPSHAVIRSRRQHAFIYFRLLVTLCSFMMSVLKPCLLSFYAHLHLFWIDILTYSLQAFGWAAHLLYLNALVNQISRGTRGPRLMIGVWILTFLFSISYARTIWASYSDPVERESLEKNTIRLYQIVVTIDLTLQVLYLCSLFPKGLYSGNQYRSPSERTPLLNTRVAHSNYSRLSESFDPFYLGTAEERVNIMSYLTFYWVNHIMEKGSHGLLECVDDLYTLPHSLRCENVYHKVNKALMLSQPLSSVGSELSYSKYSLLRALHKCFGLRFYSIGILKLVSDSLAFAGPLLLHELVSYVDGKENNYLNGYASAFGLCLAGLLSCLSSVHFNYLLAKVSIQMRASVITSIYRKVQHVSGATLSQFSTGEIVTLMSTDTDRLINFCKSFHAFWSLPLQLGVTMYLLYCQIGMAFLAGVAFAVILIPINRLIAVKIANLSRLMLRFKDKRVQLMTEVLGMIKAVKLNTWESLFRRRILDERFGEVKALAGRKYLDAACVYFWASTPVLIPIFTFVTYAILGNDMDPARVFTAVALFNMLIVPLNAFPWVLNGLVEAWVSIKRIDKLMQLPEHILNEYYTVVPEMNQVNCDLQIVFVGANFSWSSSYSQEHTNTSEESPLISPDIQVVSGIRRRHPASSISTSENYTTLQDTSRLCLKDLNIKLHKGQFVGIIGSVGSGKTALLNAILGELQKVSGAVAVGGLHQGFGLATQKPWLQNLSIKENIIFGHNFDPSRYKSVLHCCALEEDLEVLRNGEDTKCGENGSALSEGQRARVALARGVYQNKNIYLLDDVLSGIDAKVALQVMHRCIHGLLVGKTVIMVTHHIHLLNEADLVIHMDNGFIYRQGVPKEILPEISFNATSFRDAGEDSVPLTSSGAIPRMSLKPALDSQRFDHQDFSSPGEEEDEDEIRSFGELSGAVLTSYLSAVGAPLSIMIFFSLLLMQISRNLTDIWLANWVSHSPPHPNLSIEFLLKNDTMLGYPYHESVYHSSSYALAGWAYRHFVLPLPNKGSMHRAEEIDPSTRFYLTMYCILAFGNTLFTLLRAFLFAYGGVCAAKVLHRKLLDSILSSKFSFFDVNPLGRILNRFSTDIYVTDDSLPFESNILFAQLFGLIGTLVVTIYGVPWILMLYIPLMFVYYTTQDYYRQTSRDLRRIYALSLSPIYCHFTETLKGLPVIRAMRAGLRFGVYSDAFLEQNQRALFCLELVSQWLSLRLQLIGLGILAGVVLLSLWQHHMIGINPGLVGLVISYALTVIGFLNGVVTYLTSTERELISVERLNEYVEGSKREGEINPNCPPIALPIGWPRNGHIEMENVYLKYHSYNPYALRDITLDIGAGEKLCLVGRTGAGKSSVFIALFRIVELTRGRISIDGVNIADISIKKLRSSISIVSQDALVFSGTVRENLDPRRDNSEEDIWSAVQRCQLEDAVNKIGGLDAVIEKSGQNLSAGQQQLICLARATLCRTEIVCIDEGMSLLDYETELQIQDVMRNAFMNKTVLIIAHRIHTVKDCDRVVVMNSGEIVEVGKPLELLEDSTSLFHSMFHAQK